MHKAFLQNNDIKSSKSRLSHLLLHKLDLYLADVQLSLDSVLDKRLVRTFYDLIVAILLHRHNSMGLLLRVRWIHLWLCTCSRWDKAHQQSITFQKMDIYYH